MTLFAKITSVSINQDNLEVIDFELNDDEDTAAVSLKSSIDISLACYLAEYELIRSNNAFSQMIFAFANHTDVNKLVNQEFEGN